MTTTTRPAPEFSRSGTVALWASIALGLALAGAGAAAEAWTFERVLSQALTNNPDARIAAHRIAQAQAGVRQANAALWPQLQLQSSYVGGNNPTVVFMSALHQREFSPSIDFNDPPAADNLNVRGLLSMPLYQGGRISAARQAARFNTEAARHNAEAIRNSIGFEAARAFHTITKTREFIRAAEAAVQSFETNLTIATKRLDVGTILKTEVLDVEVRLAQAREDLVRARNARTLAERALRNLLGIEQGEFTIADVTPPVANPEAGDPGSRPELQAADQSIRGAEQEVRRAQAGYLPRVSAFGAYDYDHGWKFNGSGDSWTAGVALQFDLWDGQLTRGRVSESKAGLETAREEERKLRLAIDFETEQARLNLKDATERLSVTAKSVDQAAESTTLTRVRFEQGLALATQLIDAESALTAARVRRAEAEADQRIAIAALRKALGLPQLPASAGSL